MSPPRPTRTAEERAALRPHIAEWFGHRVFPTVASHPKATQDQREEACPFLSEIAGDVIRCIKAVNSRGVCTISTGSNGPRQDWLVCPLRALDDEMLDAMVRRLFGLTAYEAPHVTPVTNLSNDTTRDALVAAVHDPTAPRQFLTFQQYFGGEVGLRRTPGSPELNFDVTIVEVVPIGGGGVGLGRYGIVEVQTTDAHGSYMHAVGALRGALDLHPTAFPEQVAANPEWSGRKVEGPNISNVFKRTFYQVMFKFQIARRESSAGCILALPRPVWDSWQTFLGAPELVDLHDGTHALVEHGGDADTERARIDRPPNWIYVFDIDEQPPADGSPASVSVALIIATDTPTLSRLALDIAPRYAIGDTLATDTVLTVLRRRVSNYLPSIS